MRLRDRFRLSVGAFRVSGANRSLRWVQAARLASVTGRWAYTITLAVFAYRSGGPGGVAVAGLVRLAPAALTAPVAGALLRRAPAELVLFRGGVVRTLALAGAGAVVLAGWPPAAVYALVALESAVSTLLRPVQNSLLPGLSRTPEELTSANLALSVIESAGVLVGPLLGAALLHDTSAGIVFEAAAGAYALATVLLVPVRSQEPPATGARGRSWLLAEAVAGVRAIAGDPDARVVVGLYGAQNLVAGALNVLLVVTALRLLDMGQSGVGMLTAALGLGGVLGGAFVFARVRHGRHGIDLGVGLVLWGVPLLLLAVLSSREAAFILLGVVGVGVTVVDVAAVTLLQRSARGDLLPHALGVLQTVFVASVGIGTLCAPFLVSALGIRGALVAAGSPLPVLAVALWRRLRRLDSHAPVDAELVALLAAIPIFAPLGDASLEPLASSLREVTFDAGDAVFEQGDHGEDFYMIESGEADVTIDGEYVRTLGPGGYFGEIALLRDVPRTATVRARTDLLLQGLGRERFLATVTGNAASSGAADAVVGAHLGLRAGLSAP